MAADAPQPHLNGAFYGPSVPPPPPPKVYHRRGCSCGACCALSFLLKLIFAIIIILGLAALIFWLVVRPRELKFHVTDASLTRFDYTAGENILRYNLALNVSFRNPNKKIGVYYDRIEAHAIYEDKRFSSTWLSPFYQGHKNTTVVSPVFGGQHVVEFNGGQTKDFNEEKVAGIYSIDVQFRLRVRFKLGKVKSKKYSSKVKCDLKLPLRASNTTTGSTGFTITECDFDL